MEGKDAAGADRDLRRGGTSRMTPEELVARRADVQIVDVRWPNEWEAGRIEGSVHIRQDELDEHLDDLDSTRPVVAVCRSGSRSASAAEQLRAEGFDAASLDGGLLAWVARGFPFTGEVVAAEAPPDDRPEAHQRLQNELLSVLFAVQEQFGDREPSEDEVRAFLRQRLIDQGRTVEEADDFLAHMEDGEAEA